MARWRRVSHEHDLTRPSQRNQKILEVPQLPLPVPVLVPVQMRERPLNGSPRNRVRWRLLPGGL